MIDRHFVWTTIKKHHQHGTMAEEEIYNDENIAKCLYYGWDGDEQWEGFDDNRNKGIVLTSLALDYFHNGNTHKLANDFIDYVNSVDMPNVVLDFSKNILNAYLTDNNTMQRTETIEVTGSSDYYLTLKLQDGVTLVNETKGTEGTGTVNIYGGDKFYLKTRTTITGTWTSNDIENCKYDYQPIIYKTSKETYQDLVGKIVPVEDPSTKINLKVNWISTGNLIIKKVDAEDNSKVIPGTVFEIYDSNNNLVKTITTDNSGIAKADNLNLRNIYSFGKVNE